MYVYKSSSKSSKGDWSMIPLRIQGLQLEWGYYRRHKTSQKQGAQYLLWGFEGTGGGTNIPRIQGHQFCNRGTHTSQNLGALILQKIFRLGGPGAQDLPEYRGPSLPISHPKGMGGKAKNETHIHTHTHVCAHTHILNIPPRFWNIFQLHVIICNYILGWG